jgi:16S rRNA (uracil1498-N3)-methyltransferase
MHRFYLPSDKSEETRPWLEGSEAHHALHVVRVRPGDQVTVLDGAGGQLLCRVERCERDRVGLVAEERKTVPPPPYQITLLQAIPKGKIIESIIQKATELGAARIVPLLSDRVATRVEPAGAEKKREQWQQIAVEAIKQCGAAWMPRVETPVTPDRFLNRGEQVDVALVASLPTGICHAHQFFEEYRTRTGGSPGTIHVWIGPEGDFTREEVAAIEASGARPITLGNLVLRCETAAIYCLSIVTYELQALNS